MKYSHQNDSWRRTGEQLRARTKPSSRKSINEMNLDEALDAQAKYLKWAEFHADHEDFAVKKHIYNTYLIPRIEFLQQQQKVADILGIDSVVTTD